jgi:uncharacterized protein YndB with AHSA1/START domain
MAVQDTIERELILSVSQDRVWAAITNPRKLEKWFGSKAEIARLAVGEPIIFGWGEDEQYRGRIEAVDPSHHFAYRWSSGAKDMVTPFDEMPSTLVTFRLEAVPQGTRLTLVESGFAALPENLRGKEWQENNSGWNAELDDLQAYLRQPEEA